MPRPLKTRPLIDYEVRLARILRELEAASESDFQPAIQLIDRVISELRAIRARREL